MVRVLVALVCCIGLNAVAAAPAATVAFDRAWVREAPPGAMMLAAYLTVRNGGDRPLVLVGASSPEFASATLHRSSVVGGESRMEPVASLTVPAHGELSFAPGGLHVMLMHPAHPMHAGDEVHLRFQTADGGGLDCVAIVRRDPPR